MINLETLKVDANSNVIFFNKDGFWVKQTFDGFIMLHYEDSDGVYWDISLGIYFPYRLYTISKGSVKYMIDNKYQDTNELFLTHEFDIIKIDTHIRLIGFYDNNSLSIQLASVTPMDGPTANSVYMDYVYAEDTPTSNS